MLRVFIALTFFFLNIYACQGGYSSCIQKLKDSQSISKTTLQIPISKYKRLVFSSTKPQGKILKHDPFLSLYIVQDKKGFKYPFKINMRYPAGVSVVNTWKSKEGKIVKRQIGLNQFAKYNAKTFSPAILTNSCCALEGIVTSRGIIEKVYLNRFITKKDTRYGDVGIRVKDTKKGIQVVSYDPFMKNNPFKKGDYIWRMDGNRIKYSATLMRRILFAKIGSTHTFQVKRDANVVKIKVKAQERLSGGYKIETYLEQYGITFDKNLHIIKLDKNKKHYGLQIGDQLLRVNQHNVTKQGEVMQYISDYKLHPTLLFQRNKNFQFFVNLE